jgi:hypothetical protein
VSDPGHLATASAGRASAHCATNRAKILTNSVNSLKQNPRRDPRFHHHQHHFLQFVNPQDQRGLEIGAFDLPRVEPSEGRCDFADLNTTEQLQELACHIPGHNPEFVVPVQFDLARGYDQIPGGYDWIAAAHVIEHVPDMIGWLDTLHSKLTTNGLLFLIIPDKRYTFDVHRRESTVTELVGAYRARLTHPSFAQVFDHFYYNAPDVVAHNVWLGDPVPPPRLDYYLSLGEAIKAEGTHQDAHCWVLTPDSFSTTINALTKAKVCKLQLEDVRPTAVGALDFSAIMRRVD